MIADPRHQRRNLFEIAGIAVDDQGIVSQFSLRVSEVLGVPAGHSKTCPLLLEQACACQADAAGPADDERGLTCKFIHESEGST